MSNLIGKREISLHESLSESTKKTLKKWFNKIDEVPTEKEQLLLLNLSPKLFANFLNSKGVSKQCLSCGARKLVVPTETAPKADSGIMLLASDSPETIQKKIDDSTFKYVSFMLVDPDGPYFIDNLKYRVICENCGFIASYLTNSVIDWVTKNNDAKEKEE